MLCVQSPGGGNPYDPQVLTLQDPKGLGHPGRGPHIYAIAKPKQHTAGSPQCMAHNSWRDKDQAPLS